MWKKYNKAFINVFKAHRRHLEYTNEIDEPMVKYLLEGQKYLHYTLHLKILTKAGTQALKRFLWEVEKADDISIARVYLDFA